MSELRIDPDVCVGHGRCFDIAPDLFADDEEGFGTVTVPRPEGRQVADARLAARSCPEQAVLLTEGKPDDSVRHSATHPVR